MSVDAGLRQDGILASSLWDVVTGTGRPDATFQEETTRVKEQRCEAINHGSKICSPECTLPAANVRACSFFKDNDAVIKMTMKDGPYHKTCFPDSSC